MKLPSITKYHLNTQKAKIKLSAILSKTRKRSSVVVKFWKHIGQIVRERIPVLSPLQELIAGKGLVSEVSIIKYSISWRGRIIIICTEGLFAYIIITYGRDIYYETQTNLSNLIFNFDAPYHISTKSVVLMIVMSLGTIGYYGMIKPGDFKQAVKEHKEEEIEN